MAENKYPLIRISRLANQRVDEIVTALEARGVDITKAGFVSELILSTPIPQPTRAVEEKKRRTRKAVNQSTAAPAL